MSLESNRTVQPPGSVAVVIPTYDRAELVVRALHSALCQTRPAAEVVVVDDGSSDDTAARVRDAFPDVTLLRQEHSGVSAARNRGIEATGSAWVAFLDSDDEWLPEKLQRQLAALEQSGRLICHTREILFRDGERVDAGETDSRPDGRIYSHCLSRSVMLPSAVVMHRTVLEDVGPFDETLPVCEDYDLWLRACARYPVALVDEPLVAKHEGHADQLSQSFWGTDRFRIPVLERAWRTFELSTDERIATLQALIEKLERIVEGARERQRADVLEDLEHRIPHYERLLLLERIGISATW